ncbi:hypothetical protein Tco_0129721, partial [Tanacetum coccineum]
DSVDEEKLRRMLRKLKKIKEEDSDEESGLKSNKKGKKKEKHSDEESGLKSNKKGKKKEKQLTPEEAAHEEYLCEFPTIRARTTSNSLFSAIRKARVDMWSFLQGIGFTSFHNGVAIFTVALKVVKSRKKKFAILASIYIPYYSTKFDRFPVVRTRPAIKGWTTTLRQRQNLETKEHVIGCLELHSEWTESELQDTKGFTTGSSFENSEKEVCLIC